jgi:ketose-bisphosphate aldolase
MAVDAGFTSVMIDASKYSYDENVRITKEVVEYAHSKNVTVEAEIGHVGGMEDNNVSDIVFADYDECVRFINDTGIDSLAPAIGTVHGIYKGELKIDYELIERLSSLSIPLVMHGGSGLELDILKRCVDCGINKINVNSDLQKVWHDAVKDFINTRDVYDPRKVIMSGETAILNEMDKKLSILK